MNKNSSCEGILDLTTRYEMPNTWTNEEMDTDQIERISGEQISGLQGLEMVRSRDGCGDKGVT